MIKINILHVIHSLDVGGAEKLVVEFTKGTNKDMFNVMVCCLDKIGELGEELISNGFDVETLDRRPGIDWRLVFRLRKLLKKKKIDVIHAHQYTSFFYSSLAKNFPKKPRLIFTEHGRFFPDQRRIKRVIFNPFLSKCASEIIAISEATKVAMVKFDNFPQNRVKIIYNGVTFKASSTNLFKKRSELNISNEDFVLSTAARLDPIKNYKMLITVMKRITRTVNNCKLLIAGNGPEYDTLSSEIIKNELTESVFLLGHRSDVKEIFSASDVFLLSSLSEGTSITLLEAMSAGLPAIATNVGGNPEIIVEGETGLLVKSNDAEAMADKVLYLHQNRMFAKQLGEAGKKRAEELFSYERMMDKYEQLYVKYADYKGN